MKRAAVRNAESRPSVIFQSDNAEGKKELVIHRGDPATSIRDLYGTWRNSRLRPRRLASGGTRAPGKSTTRTLCSKTKLKEAQNASKTKR
jgi:hypothetical protein